MTIDEGVSRGVETLRGVHRRQRTMRQAVIVTLVGAYEECGRGMRRYKNADLLREGEGQMCRWCAEVNIARTCG